ncbi:MAG TPA: signal peptidase II [Phycisphaerales bacterium]|nr:signal peptidase II [Phycisphaerales bacterium]
MTTEFQKSQTRGGRSRTIENRKSSHALRTALPGLAAQLIFWPLTAAGFALDLWSKRAVFDWLQQQQGGSVSIINGFLRLVTAENAGAAFGIATGQRHLLVAVSIIALIVILAVFLFSGAEHKLMYIALALFTAGVCGNLYDRIFNNGRVRDFIDVVYWPGRHWPAFNLADTMLCVGVGLIIISSFFTDKSARKHAQQHI